MLAWVAAVVAHIRFGAQAPFEGIADCISRAIAALLTRHDGDASDGRVGIGDGALRADASE